MQKNTRLCLSWTGSSDSSTYSNNFSTYGKTPALVARSLDSNLHAHYPWLLLLCLALLVYMVYPLDGSYGTPRSSWTGDSYPAEKAMMILKWDTLTITQSKTKLNEQQQWLRKRNPWYASQATVIIVMQQSIPHKHQNRGVNRTLAKKNHVTRELRNKAKNVHHWYII